MRFRFIAVEKAFYPVTILCRVLEVSTSGFYAWLRRPPSLRAQENEVLRREILMGHQSPLVTNWL